MKSPEKELIHDAGRSPTHNSDHCFTTQQYLPTSPQSLETLEALPAPQNPVSFYKKKASKALNQETFWSCFS